MMILWTNEPLIKRELELGQAGSAVDLRCLAASVRIEPGCDRRLRAGSWSRWSVTAVGNRWQWARPNGAERGAAGLEGRPGILEDCWTLAMLTLGTD